MRLALTAVELETVQRLTAPLQVEIDALARAARAVDGVSPFGEHKWLRLVRGEDHSIALLVWRNGSDRQLLGAAQCVVHHTARPAEACRLTAELVVDSVQRGRGLGTYLVRSVFERAREEGAGQVHLWAYGNLPQARRLAELFNCHPERVLCQYGLSVERLPDPPSWPPDIRVRAFRANADADTWLSLNNRVFAGHPEQGSWVGDDLQARLAQPWFDPDDLLVAEDARSGAMLGFCWTKLPRDAALPGEIYIVGVDPRARDRGLGRRLTQAGLAHIRARGRPGATLYVESDNVPAIALYEDLGFERRWEHVCYAGSAPQDD